MIEYPPSNQCAGGGWIGEVDANFPPNTVGNTTQITIARFDGLSAIPSNAVVTDATLSVYQTNELGTDPKVVSILDVITDWDSSADWLWPWSNVGGDYGSEWNTFEAPGNNAWSDPAGRHRAGRRVGQWRARQLRRRARDPRSARAGRPCDRGLGHRPRRGLLRAVMATPRRAGHPQGRPARRRCYGVVVESVSVSVLA
ncbi:hypothetical protein OJ997_17765 [Solirubrobacter phytolaccae]|uniref:DNRLRE domain-containing protein n=1 Tax=Solirubrobacter phytolaccae TaxID=1404360 RepID=A0A9X3NIW8_9ACTN|nr:hypothetical protein [Solirubrobacter phytolaccae]MDA0182157.1 hypothetical protein [Solirubrobacter phytolaccae]